MKAAIGLPTTIPGLDPVFPSGDTIAEMALSAETAGFDAVFVADHPFPTDEWLAGLGAHSPDPIVLLSIAAAATTRLRLLTMVYVLPYRNPFLTAKSLSTLDFVSNGRLIAGVGTGYVEPEFQALGVSFEERNELVDEAIVMMKQAWTGRPIRATGLHWQADGNTLLPRPIQRPGPPVWIGGNSKRAIRRAAELAEGWMPQRNREGRARTPSLGTDELVRNAIEYLRTHAEQIGRTAPIEIAFIPIDRYNAASHPEYPTHLLQAAKELASVGVNYLLVWPSGYTVDAYFESVDEIGKLLPAFEEL